MLLLLSIALVPSEASAKANTGASSGSVRSEAALTCSLSATAYTPYKSGTKVWAKGRLTRSGCSGTMYAWTELQYKTIFGTWWRVNTDHIEIQSGEAITLWVPGCKGGTKYYKTVAWITDYGGRTLVYDVSPSARLSC
jgi:hypothetical protein